MKNVEFPEGFARSPSAGHQQHHVHLGDSVLITKDGEFSWKNKKVILYNLPHIKGTSEWFFSAISSCPQGGSYYSLRLYCTYGEFFYIGI